jgi:hypothetical protein
LISLKVKKMKCPKCHSTKLTQTFDDSVSMNIDILELMENYWGGFDLVCLDCDAKLRILIKSDLVGIPEPKKRW